MITQQTASQHSKANTADNRLSAMNGTCSSIVQNVFQIKQILLVKFKTVIRLILYCHSPYVKILRFEGQKSAPFTVNHVAPFKGPDSILDDYTRLILNANNGKRMPHLLMTVSVSKQCTLLQKPWKKSRF